MGDPQTGLSLAYVTNQMGFHLFDDPREKAVRDACYRSLDAIRTAYTRDRSTRALSPPTDGHLEVLESRGKQVGKNSCNISENSAGCSKLGA